MSQQQEPGGVHDVYPPTDELTAHQARDAIMSRDAVRPHDHGLDVKETDSDGRRVVTASASDQVLAQYTVKESTNTDKTEGPFTIGQALETAAWTAGDEPMNKADAAAVQAAEA